MELAVSASDGVKAALARIGRTEDCRFSPDGRRIAVAGLLAERILIVGLEAELDGARRCVRLTNRIELESDALAGPHGVAWLDGSTLAVANRAGGVALFELPDEAAGEAPLRLAPIQFIAPAAENFAETPGSVSARVVGLDLVELVLCNNYVHYVSRQLLDRRRGYAPLGGARFAGAGLDVPDGVAHCPSGRWIAVSNHYRGCVFVYRNDAAWGPEAAPAGVLVGVDFPHGLAFAPDGSALFVADAGAPFVRLYRSADGDWSGERGPEDSLRALDDESFRRGRTNPEEGGPKGVTVRGDGRLMATSCTTRPLAFFDLAGLGLRPAPPAAEESAEAARAALLGCLDGAKARGAAAAEAARREGALRAEGMAASRSWRMTAPLRRAASALRRFSAPPTEAATPRD